MRRFILATCVAAATNAAVSADIEVVGMDYAFKVPSEIPSGPTSFRFRNAGKQSHELNIALLKPGVTVQQFMAAANAAKPISGMLDGSVGVLFAQAGKRSAAALSADLIAGRTYIVRCIFKDSASAPRHEMLGMYSAIRVTAAKAATSTSGVVDTIAGMDYAFRYPRTLAPGRHRFAFTNIGQQRHEFSIQLLKRGATLDQIAKADANGEDVDKFFDNERFGLLVALGGTRPIGLLEVDLLPGRDYMIECGLSDSVKAKPHYMLGMTGLIHVTGPRAR
jgi:hypothetical protein